MARFKTVIFKKIVDESGIQGLIDLLNANAETMMGTISFGSVFWWDFDINPALDPNHSMSGSPYEVFNSSGYNSQQSVGIYSFSDTGFTPLSPPNIWRLFTESAQLGGLMYYIVWLTWVDYPGPARMLHLYNEFIGDPDNLQPPENLDVPEKQVSGPDDPYGNGTLNPAVVIDPIPFSSPYKLAIPNYHANYFHEENIFQVK